MQVTACPWPRQRQRRDDAQADVRIAGGTPVEFIQQGIGLADPERRGQHNARPYAVQGRFDHLADIVEYAGHALRYSRQGRCVVRADGLL